MTINGLYRTALIKPRKPLRTVEEVEYATAGWVDWFNHHRLYEYCGDIPPVEMEPPTALERRDQSPAEFIKESLRTRRAVQAWQRVKSTCSQSCDAVETSRTGAVRRQTDVRRARSRVVESGDAWAALLTGLGECGLRCARAAALRTLLPVAGVWACSTALSRLARVSV